jgi:outer membrane protein assembly factor BamB
LKHTLTKFTPLILAALLSGCATKSEPPAVSGPVPPESFIKTWSTPAPYKKVTNFTKSGELLFVYGPDREVTAIDFNGGVQFKTQLGKRFDQVGPGMTQADRVIFPTSSSLEIVSRQGIHRKSIALPHPVRSPGVAAEETVYLGSDSDTGGRIAAVGLDRDYDVYRWTRLAGLVSQPPVLFENSLYFATEEGSVYAVTNAPAPFWPASDEKPSGAFKTDGNIRAALRIDEGGVYVASTDTKLYCLDPINGNIRWIYYAQESLTQTPTPGADTLYVPVAGKGLVAIDKKSPGLYTRQPKWTNAEAKNVVAEDARYAYVLTKSGQIAALDRATGQLKFATQRSDIEQVVSSMGMKDPTLFAVTKTNQIVAFKPVFRPGFIGEIVMVEVETPVVGG